MVVRIHIIDAHIAQLHVTPLEWANENEYPTAGLAGIAQ